MVSYKGENRERRKIRLAVECRGGSGADGVKINYKLSLIERLHSRFGLANRIRIILRTAFGQRVDGPHKLTRHVTSQVKRQRHVRAGPPAAGRLLPRPRPLSAVRCAPILVAATKTTTASFARVTCLRRHDKLTLWPWRCATT